MNIFVDTGEAGRIYFQANKADSPKERNAIPLSIADEPQKLNGKLHPDLNEEDVDKVRQFVRNNKDALLRLGKEDSIKDFLENMKVFTA
jgi:hypothetical protein